MVEHKALPRKLLHKLRSNRQMTRIYKDVISQPEFLECRHATQKLRTKHETVIRFTLEHMPDPQQLWISAEVLQLRAHIIRLQVHPPDDSENKWGGCRQFKQPARLLNCLLSLHCNGAVESSAFQFRLQVRRQKITPQPAHPLVNPAIFFWVVMPEVLMGVNPHAEDINGDRNCSQI